MKNCSSVRRIDFLVLAILGVSICGASAQAGGRGIRVRPTGPELIEAEPRQIVTTAFRVSNETAKKREFEARVKLPAGWKPISTEFPFVLGPQQSDIRVVSIFVPLSTLAGKYSITYRVSDRQFPSIGDLYSITVVVLPVSKLEVKLLEVPQFVIAGDQYKASFVILNLGNGPVTVSPKIESGKDYPAIPDTGEVPLKPGESKTINVAVTTDAAINRKTGHRLKLVARVTEPGKPPWEASAESWVEIIPRVTGKVDPFHRLPIEIKLRGGMGENSGSTYVYQAEVSGRGTLDEEGKNHIDFLFRAPNTLHGSVFGSREEYRLSYWTDKYAIHLGDRVYSLSPLTEFFAYGRGIEGKLTLDDFTAGAYHVEFPWRE